MVNPLLLAVSALFFIALLSGFYLISWLAATAYFRIDKGATLPKRSKRILEAALLLPPFAAVLLTLGGATLRHSHAAPKVEHHNDLCRMTFGLLNAGQGEPGRDMVDSIFGAALNGGAWLLLAAGVFYLARLVWATLSLEREIRPFLRPPSPRLAASLERVRRRFPRLPVNRFYECAIPMSCSSLLSGLRVRCVLSADLVKAVSEDELDAVVAHEASHLRTGDVPFTFLLGLLNCGFFYLRPVRLLTRQWREAAELACDQTAVGVTGQPLSMASAILRASGVDLGETDRPAPAALPAASIGFTDEAACPPEKRVERLLALAEASSDPQPDTRFKTWAGWAASLGLAGFSGASLVSAQVMCIAHCSLEAVARFLP